MKPLSRPSFLSGLNEYFFGFTRRGLFVVLAILISNLLQSSCWRHYNANAAGAGLRVIGRYGECAPSAEPGAVTARPAAVTDLRPCAIPDPW